MNAAANLLIIGLLAYPSTKYTIENLSRYRGKTIKEKMKLSAALS
ncbi:MAG: hypothetical protein ABSD50_04815 [Smithella sp.]